MLTCIEANVIAINEQYGSGWFDRALCETELKSEGWSFAGFDVLDLRGLISGLSGCGYESGTKHQLQAYFGRALNEAGLFGTSSWAARFAEVRGLQITQHAPFIPTGVWIREPR